VDVAESTVAGAHVARPPKLFISYRRDDTGAFVGALDRRLRQDLGSWNVFRDVQNMIAGERFELRISDQIEQSDVVLVVIGPRWEGAAEDRTSQSRLAHADDFVRQEVRIALKNRPRSTPIPDSSTEPRFLRRYPPISMPSKSTSASNSTVTSSYEKTHPATKHWNDVHTIRFRGREPGRDVTAERAAANRVWTRGWMTITGPGNRARCGGGNARTGGALVVSSVGCFD
jgi:TIR domain